jgi:hypothetical protein
VFGINNEQTEKFSSSHFSREPIGSCFNTCMYDNMATGSKITYITWPTGLLCDGLNVGSLKIGTNTEWDTIKGVLN